MERERSEDGQVNGVVCWQIGVSQDSCDPGNTSAAHALDT